MKDITRFLIFIVMLNFIMGFISVAFAEETAESIDQQALHQLSENVRSTIDNERDSDISRPENYQGQQSFGSEETLGLRTIVDLLFKGLDPFPEPPAGYKSSTGLYLMKVLGWIRVIIHLMTGILIYLVIKNKMT